MDFDYLTWLTFHAAQVAVGVPGQLPHERCKKRRVPAGPIAFKPRWDLAARPYLRQIGEASSGEKGVSGGVKGFSWPDIRVLWELRVALVIHGFPREFIIADAGVHQRVHRAMLAGARM